MSTRVADRVEEWEEQSFAGGYRGLHQLAESEFSGVVSAGGVEVYMTRGVVVGVRGGDIEDVEDASGVARGAPSPALALLAVMQDEDRDARDSFYTEQTAIAAVDQTLSEGGFTGYIELSENVLSGDYYLVYHAGESSSVAFVGESSRLVTGDEAFETAVEEVGIYEVYPADVTPVDLPEHEPADGSTATESDSDDGPGSAVSTDDEESDVTTGAGESPAHIEQDDGLGEVPSAPGDGSGETPAGESADAPDGSRVGTGDIEESDGRAVGSETADLEVRTIPSLNPGRTDLPGQGTTGADGQSADAGGDGDPGRAADTAAEGATPEGRGADGAASDEGVATAGERHADSEAGVGTAEGETVTVDPEQLERLEGRVRELEREREELETRVQTLETEREELETRVQTLETEREELESRVRTLETERDELSAQPEGGEHGSVESRPEIAAQNARSETTVFVRYRSRSGVTLDTVHSGDGDRETLRENLRLEVYGGFDQPVAVDGRPYEEFVTGTVAYQFIEWVVGTLVFEIRETGNTGGLEGLYDTLPEIDHVKLRGTVPVDAEGQQSDSFDVVFRNQREQPLAIARIDSTRDPVTDDQMETFVTDATTVDSAVDSLRAAVLVTGSRFAGSALETAAEATKGRRFSRSSRRSFVNRSRTEGYHLCLVEMRGEVPHLVVPEL